MENQPRRNKSKEELRAQMENSYEVERQRQLVKDAVFPSMYASCSTIGEAKVLLEYASSLIYQRATRKMYDGKMTDIDIISSMNQSETAEKYKEFFKSFDSLTVGSAMTLVDQLKQSLQNYIENKVDKSPLSEANIEEIVEKSRNNTPKV